MINIAIDGPSGSGKSTVAKIISKSLDILYLDTGAMYRACGLKARSLGIDCRDEKGVSTFIDNIDLKVKYLDGVQHVFLDGRDVSTEIRSNDVAMLASDISSLPIVRKKMVEMQREVATQQACVLDGRDICMYVLPDAKYKFYITATAEIRAERRYKELISRGHKVDFQTVLEEINLRDKNDSSRSTAPLEKAPDAELIDSSFMTAEEVASRIIERVKIGEKQ